jgi:mono/diheme cytochrome c family protein
MPDGTVMTDDGTVEPAATVAGEKPVSFRDQVVPVLRQHCATCHTAGGPGASYVTMFDAQGAPQYANVKDSIGWMLLAIQNGRMPKDAPNSLSKDEFDTLDNWAAADTPDN